MDFTKTTRTNFRKNLSVANTVRYRRNSKEFLHALEFANSNIIKNIKTPFSLFLLVLFLSLLLPSFSFAANPPIDPLSALNSSPNSLLPFALSVMGILLITMIVIAASVYVIGQMFGADLRAKASTWTESMLTAVGVSALVIIIMFFLLSIIQPSLNAGGEPSSVDFLKIFSDLKTISENSLAFLTIVFAILAAVFYAAGMMFGAETRARATGFANNLLASTFIVAIVYFVVFKVFLAKGGAFDSILQTKIGTAASISPYADLMINVFFFVSLIIFLTYIVSKVFRVPEWEGYLNVELSNLFRSFLLVLFVAGLFVVGSQIVSAWANDAYHTNSPSLAAINFLQEKALDPVLNGIYDVYSIQSCTSMLSVYARRIGESVLTRTYKVFPGIDTFVSISNVLSYGLVAVYGSLSAQISLLYFIDSTMGNFFLPAGLILHFFPPTRDAGAFLMAFALGFQIVFPMGYLIDKKAYEDLGPSGYQSPNTLIYSICGPVKYGAFGYFFNPATAPGKIFEYLPKGTAVQKSLGNFFSEGVLGLLPMPEFTIIMRHFAVLTLLSLFMPALSIMVTIAFINAMTKFILMKM
ncbi:hypothetical protein HY988_00780 [Candidatus Micrarchaeota archaeon]|nr:hypothetical protein [Candidatus Micrarchaeota archaeon]